MIRTLYRCLLWLHPPAFRRAFGAEMLWIFDEAAATEGTAALFLDGLASLLRQWVLRSGFWKVALALTGGALQVSLGGALLFAIHRREPVPTSDSDLDALIRLTVFMALGLLTAVISLVYWWRAQSRRASRRIGV